VAFAKQYYNTTLVLIVPISTPHSAVIYIVQYLHIHSRFALATYLTWDRQQHNATTQNTALQAHSCTVTRWHV